MSRDREGVRMALRAATDDESQAMTFNGAVAARPTLAGIRVINLRNSNAAT